MSDPMATARAGRDYGPARRSAARSPGRRRVRRAALLVVLGLELALVGGLVVSVRAALPSRLPKVSVPVTFAADAVAAHPRAYAGRELAVAGVVGDHPRRRAARDRWAFLLEGRHDHRLLVVGTREQPLTIFRKGTRVVVHGRLTVPRHRAHRAPASRAAVAHRSHAAGILAAERITLDRSGSRR